MGYEQETRKTACPIPQMSFGDISRYLQGGFDQAVRRAISGHITYCNSCQEELDRIKSLRKAGRRIIVSRLSENEQRVEVAAADHVDDVTLAAFVDKGLGTSERASITEHLGHCHACYLQYSALVKELESPVTRPLRAPAEVTETMKLPVAEPREVIGLAHFARKLVETVEGFVEKRWTQPALAFALGLIVMLMFLPSAKTVIPLPGFSPLQNGFDDKVRSSVNGEEVEINPRPVILIPADAAGRLEFTWPGPAELTDGFYRVEIFNSADQQVLDSLELTENKWVADGAIFRPGLRYEFLVSRIGHAGGVQPVSQQSLLVAR